MVKKKSAPKVKEQLDITDELIAERRTSLKMPRDMKPWMAKTIEFIDAKMLITGKIVSWACLPLIFCMVYEVIARHFFGRFYQKNVSLLLRKPVSYTHLTLPTKA